MAEIVDLPLTDIAPFRENPRLCQTSEELLDLTEDIRARGVLQPITVRPCRDGEAALYCSNPLPSFVIVMGYRRWMASSMAGKETIPAIIVGPMDDVEQITQAYCENEKRQSLSPMERARTYRTLLQKTGMTQQALGDHLGVSQESICYHIRLLDLPEETGILVDRGTLPHSTARELFPLIKSPELCNETARVAITEKWGIEATRARVVTVKPETTRNTPVRVRPNRVKTPGRTRFTASAKSCLIDLTARWNKLNPKEQKTATEYLEMILVTLHRKTCGEGAK